MIYVLVFVGSGAVVVIAGSKLTRYADGIADATGLGRLWIGSVLLAGATSLPELATGLGALRLGAPDLAAGDVFGSSMANMLILAVIGLLPRKHVLARAALDHALAASLAIALGALAAVFLLFRPGFTLWRVAPGSVILFLGYLAGTRAGYRHSREVRAERDQTGGVEPEPPLRAGLRRHVVGFAVVTAILVVAAVALAWAARGIAEITGASTTLIGTWLVGTSTSLPELVACLAAVRLGAFDLAVGNLFGSNAFNMALFLPYDLATPHSLFGALAPAEVVSALAAIVLMALGLAAIAYRAERRFALIEPDSLLIVACYALAIALLYANGAGANGAGS